MYFRYNGIYVAYFYDSSLDLGTVPAMCYFVFFLILLRVYDTKCLSNIGTIYTVKKTNKKTNKHKLVDELIIIWNKILPFSNVLYDIQRVKYTCSINAKWLVEKQQIPML